MNVSTARKRCWESDGRRQDSWNPPYTSAEPSRLAKELGHLSDLTKAIRNPVLYPVEFSPALRPLA